MPANSRIAGGGGALYQNPWGYGTGGGSGWGGSFGGGGGMMGGGMMGGGYPGGGFIGGGGYPGGGPFPGGSWFPGGGGGGPLGPRPGSDKANDLAAGRTHHPQMYDLDDNWVGAEGGGAAEANWEGGGVGNAGATGTPWQDTMFAPLGYKMGIDFAGYNPGQGQDTGSSYEDYEDTDIGFMQDANTGYSPTTGGRVHSGPLAYSDTSGYSFSGGPLADKQAYMDMVDFGPQIDSFANINNQPQVNLPGPQESWSAWSAPTAPVPIRPAWSPPSMTPTAPATPVFDDFSGMKQAQMKASTAAAKQRYLDSLDESQQRSIRSMSEAQRAAAMEQAAIRAGQGLLAADIEGDDQGYSESGMGQQGGRGHPGMR